MWEEAQLMYWLEMCFDGEDGSGCKQVSCSHHFQPGSLVVALGVFARESGWCGGEDCVSRLQQFSGGRNIGAHGLAHFHLTQSRLPPQNTHSTSNKRISFESRFALLSFVVPEHHHAQTLWQWQPLYPTS
jgi:hypothetical protein